MLDRIMSRVRRAREKERLRHEERREANATEPSAVFENASDEEITIGSVWLAECDNQDGLRFVDFDGAYRLPAVEMIPSGGSKVGMVARRSCLACHEEWGMHHRCPAMGGRWNCC